MHVLNLDFSSEGQCIASQYLVLVCGTHIHPAAVQEVLSLVSPSEHLSEHRADYPSLLPEI